MSEVTRRRFLQTGAVVAAGSSLAGRKLWAAPGDKLRVGLIAVGGMGGYAVDKGCDERVVAICDIDEGNLGRAMKDKIQPRLGGLPAPQVYHDYRKMIEEQAKELDVVLISTPDHDHAPAAIRAIHAGLHVFCQKPLAHNIRECYELAKAAQAKGVLTQMGNQGHTGESLRRACEYLQAGAVGAVTATHTLLGRNFGGTGGRPASKPVPAGVHWQEWLGPAPFRDYHDGLHAFSWRSWRDFGTGTIGDMATHNLDCLFFALKVYEAKSFSCTCLATNGGSAEMWAQNNVVRYDIPARGALPAFQAFVYDHGDLKPEVMKEAEKEYEIKFGEDTLYLGEQGKFWTKGTASGAMMLPLDKHAEYPQPAKTLPRAHGGPIEDLYWAIKNGGTPVSNFPDAGTPLTAFALVGHLAQRAGIGQTVEWDVTGMRCTNRSELNEFVKRTYRPGWEV
ncbi:MAG: Gfo/Idh/MocA family oxidoreductase [Fimbriimonadaceae bacterium]|nr:Gfo/Idh/MocA family oxidoreductase [Fimbriimonadaceae bacterium]